MPSFVKGGTAIGPFGKNVYLRSTKGCKFESYTCAKNSVPYETVNDNPNGTGSLQKILQPGTAMAKITVGPDTGKIGPVQAAGTAEVQTLTPSGTISGGTFTITFSGQTTAAIAFNATAATIQAALEALSNVAPGDVVAAGGPINTTPVTLTFYSALQGDQPQVTITSSLTGSTPAVTPTTTTAGVAGAADGRQLTANYVGIVDTFLPWQLLERDVEVGVLYDGTVVQGWCFELNAAGQRIAMSNTTRDALRNQVGIDITAK
jgi:hypothetical protein